MKMKNCENQREFKRKVGVGKIYNCEIVICIAIKNNNVKFYNKKFKLTNII